MVALASRSRHLLVLPALAAGLFVFVAADTASAALPPAVAGAKDKRFRFHGETDFLGWTHFNPDGSGDSTNTVGFGFGRRTGVDRAFPFWSLGFGYVFLQDRAVVGARFAFTFDSSKDDDTEDFDEDAVVTSVSGLFVPYFRWMFLPGKRIRPFAEFRFGLGGTSTSVRGEDSDDKATRSTIGPFVGAAGGASFFLIDAFSIDAGVTFDYWAPHDRTRFDPDPIDRSDDSYSKSGDAFNLAIQAGFSVWFG